MEATVQEAVDEPAPAPKTNDFLVPTAQAIDALQFTASQIPSDLQELLESMPISNLLELLGDSNQFGTTKDFESLLQEDVELPWLID